MGASVFLRCDSLLSGERRPAVVLIGAISAVAARDDATAQGWSTRRSAGGHSGPVRDYCPRCTELLKKVRNPRL